jgi:hypothetical protein
MTHKCVADGCKREISMTYLMCRPHWRKVPRQIQRAILNTLGDRDRRLYELHVREAIDAVSKVEAKQLELKVAG